MLVAAGFSAVVEFVSDVHPPAKMMLSNKRYRIGRIMVDVDSRERFNILQTERYASAGTGERLASIPKRLPPVLRWTRWLSVWCSVTNH